jgi:hypothetical protein
MSKRTVLGSLVGVKDTDFVGRSEAETLETGAVGRVQGYKRGVPVGPFET